MRIDSQPFLPSIEMLGVIDNVTRVIQSETEDFKTTWKHRWFTNYARGHRFRFASDLDLAKQYLTPQSEVLEYGPIPLIFTGALKQLGYHIKCLDIAPENFAHSIKKLGLDIEKCNFEIQRVPFDSCTFDVIIFNEIFEHLRINPIFVFEEILRVLKPGGVLLLSTPNLRSLQGIKNFLFYNLCFSCVPSDIYGEYEKLKLLGYMGHVREYTSREVAEFLEKVGFLIHKVVFRGLQTNILAKVATSLWPGLRPIISVIAVKPNEMKVGNHKS